MLYMIVPHVARKWMDLRMFSNYAVAEHTALMVARAIELEGKDPDWCEIVAYEGLDELRPVFVYTLVGSRRLHREPWPTPSP